MSEFTTVAKVNDIPVGEGQAFAVNGRMVAVFNEDGKFFAIDDFCPHMGASLAGGYMEKGVVTCPWHEWRFDARTGVNTDDATCKVATYPVKVEGGSVLVQV